MDQGSGIVEVGIVELNLKSGATEIIFDSVCREDILTARHREESMGWIFRNSTFTVEEVRKAPLLTTLLPKIQSIINQYSVGATAYNRDFDFLESRGILFPAKLPCLMELARQLCKLPSHHPSHGCYKWPKVEEAWSYFFPDQDYAEAHRGADDALHEAKLSYALYRRDLFKV